MSKWNEENVLYFASTKSKGFKVSNDAQTQVELRKLVKSMIKRKLLRVCGQRSFFRMLKTTEEGDARLAELQAEYRKSKPNNKVSEKSGDEAVNAKGKGFYVYFGYDKRSGSLVYIGTTIQNPADRWRWHKHNGKDLNFKLHKVCESAEQMIDLEFELIKKHKPKMNKITNRKQNLNVKLTKDELEARKGDKEWCQSCLKRRAKKSNKCNYC